MRILRIFFYLSNRRPDGNHMAPMIVAKRIPTTMLTADEHAGTIPSDRNTNPPVVAPIFMPVFTILFFIVRLLSAEAHSLYRF